MYVHVVYFNFFSTLSSSGSSTSLPSPSSPCLRKQKYCTFTSALRFVSLSLSWRIPLSFRALPRSINGVQPISLSLHHSVTYFKPYFPFFIPSKLHFSQRFVFDVVFQWRTGLMNTLIWCSTIEQNEEELKCGSRKCTLSAASLWRISAAESATSHQRRSRRCPGVEVCRWAFRHFQIIITLCRFLDL